MYCTLLLLLAAADDACRAQDPVGATSTNDATAMLHPVSSPSVEDNDIVIAQAGGDEMGTRQVMIEIRVPGSISRDDAFAFASQALDVSGLHLDEDYGAVPMEPADDRARDLEESSEQIYLVRGVLNEEAIEALKATDRVVNVFDEGRIEHFEVD